MKLFCLASRTASQAASVFLLIAPILFAGGPKDPVASGRFLSWDPSTPVNFAADQGPLGSLSNAQATELVRSAVKKWEDVPTSVLRFNDAGPLEQDVTAANYKSFMQGQERRENPIVFDTDGGIIEDVLGKNASESTLGFHQVRFVSGDRYVSGWVVLNGKFATDPDFEHVILHESGHLLGLDHTQAGRAFAMDLLPENNRFVPLMFPLLVQEATQQPLRDDVAWISWLYPEATFRESTGAIRGKVLRRSGSPFFGANVVAVRVDEQLAESQEEMVSVVSDFLLTGDGAYEIPGLTAGNYVVFIEPLDERFKKGSGVGPHEERFTRFPKDYYNGSSESGTDSDKTAEKEVISMAAGQTVQEINLISNETVNDLDSLTDDDEMIYVFPAGLSFPFFGKTYTEVVVNSDGNLTFVGGDAKPGAARSEERFLAGFPRIAPLFTDLDPGRAGDGKDIKATVGNGAITFSWENVPEFSEAGDRPGNTFSVTLFANGDIRFKFEKVDVTADPDNLQAIVGITPGSASSGTRVDFSEEPMPISIGSSSIYQVFSGNTFDLNQKEILFKASASTVVAANLYFPFYQGNEQNFTGYAVTNYSDIGATLQIDGRDKDGALLPFPGNPSSEPVAAQTQTAKLGSEFFNVSPSTPQSGWVQMTSDRAEVASFFQFGNGLSGPLTKMDGSVAFKSQAKTLYFTRLHHGPAAFRGIRDAQTTLNLANPNDTAVTLTFRLFSPTGAPIGTEVNRPLPGRGMLFESLSSLFGVQTPVTDGFVRVQVDGEGAVGFELIEAGDTLLGLNASFGNTQNVSYSAQLGNGSASGSSVYTSLKLVNTSAEIRAVTVTAFREDGSELGRVGPFQLIPNQTFQRDVNQMFGLGPNTGSPTTGSMVVEATGPGIIGDVVFGDPVQIEFAAALPLQTQRFTRAIFSQVANGSLDPNNPSMNAFTGIALFNPDPESATVKIQVFDRDGKPAGSKDVTLGKTGRLSDTVSNLIPSSGGLLRGYIILESTRPLVAQQLFGNVTLKFLSAVPPTVIAAP